jgi:hypothetical protein
MRRHRLAAGSIVPPQIHNARAVDGAAGFAGQRLMIALRRGCTCQRARA